MNKFNNNNFLYKPSVGNDYMSFIKMKAQAFENEHINQVYSILEHQVYNMQHIYSNLFFYFKLYEINNFILHNPNIKIIIISLILPILCILFNNLSIAIDNLNTIIVKFLTKMFNWLTNKSTLNIRGTYPYKISRRGGDIRNHFSNIYYHKGNIGTWDVSSWDKIVRNNSSSGNGGDDDRNKDFFYWKFGKSPKWIFLLLLRIIQQMLSMFIPAINNAIRQFEVSLLQGLESGFNLINNIGQESFNFNFLVNFDFALHNFVIRVLESISMIGQLIERIRDYIIKVLEVLDPSCTLLDNPILDLERELPQLVRTSQNIYHWSRRISWHIDRNRRGLSRLYLDTIRYINTNQVIMGIRSVILRLKQIYEIIKDMISNFLKS